MSITKTLQRTFLLPVVLFVFIASSFLATLIINTNAQSISLEPLTIDRSNPDERGWFLYNVKPGETISDTVVVRNATEFDTKIQLNANDATVTTDGTFSLAPNKVENSALGSWVSLGQDTVQVNGGESIGVPFTITVPQNATSGEYAGGLSAVIIDDSKEGGIGATLRLGVRMYLTVDGSLNLDPSISSMQITNPQLPDFEDKLRSRGSITPESMGFFLTAKELGNIYSKSVNKATFTLPDGKTETKNFTRNYIPGQEDNEFYLQTNLPYQVGETKITLDYDAAPFINNKPNLDPQTTSGSLAYTMNLTQDDLDQLIELYNKIKDEKDSRRAKATPSTPIKDNGKFTVQEGNLTEVTPAATNDVNQYLIYGLIGTIVVLIAAMGFILLKKKKDTSDTKELKKTDKKSK